jgi:hypothetical protein
LMILIFPAPSRRNFISAACALISCCTFYYPYGSPTMSLLSLTCDSRLVSPFRALLTVLKIWLNSWIIQ